MPRELLFSVTKKDFVITYFSGSGAGGQHRNKSQNCVRIHHPNSGATSQGTEQRSRVQNKIMAFRRLVKSDKFQNWLRIEASRKMLNQVEINKWVDEQMHEKNLIVEYLNE